jgi:biopolymer transport protein ExbD
MLFLLASVAAGIVFTQIDTQLPDKAPPSTSVTQPSTNPDDQPLKLVVSITRDRVILWSISGLEGTLAAPKQVFQRSGRDGEACDGAYMCESNSCDAVTQRCVPSRDEPAPVFNYRAINDAMFEIANRRYTGKLRKPETYQAILMADGAIPYSTIVAVMGAMRCKLPDFGKEVAPCALPTEDPALKKAKDPIAPNGKLFDTSRATYDPKKMALFHDILFSSGFE